MPQPPEIVYQPILPELIVIGVGAAILLIDAIWPSRDQRLAAGLSLLGLAGGAAASVWIWFAVDDRVAEGATPAAAAPTFLGGMVAGDKYAAFFRLVILASAAVAVLLGSHYLRRTGEERGEFYALVMFATSGMTLLAAAADLIVVFLALEVLSLSLYVLAGFSWRRLASQEASLKYFLLGAFSSAFFLYGSALAYGATGTTSFAGISDAL